MLSNLNTVLEREMEQMKKQRTQLEDKVQELNKKVNMMSNITVVDHSEIERVSAELLETATEEVLIVLTSDMEKIFMRDLSSDELNAGKGTVLKLIDNQTYLDLMKEVQKEVKRLRSYESYFERNSELPLK